MVGERLFGLTDIRERSLPYRVQTAHGWDMYAYWHTAYAWLASDVGFVGVVLLMIVFGWMTAKAWIDAREGNNPASVVLFTLVATVIWYLPANNQVLAFPEQMVAFWIWLLVWLRTRRAPTWRPYRRPVIGGWDPAPSQPAPNRSTSRPPTRPAETDG